MFCTRIGFFEFKQCVAHSVSFGFRQCGTNFVKDGRVYRLQTKNLCSQARKAGINCPF